MKQDFIPPRSCSGINCFILCCNICQLNNRRTTLKLQSNVLALADGVAANTEWNFFTGKPCSNRSFFIQCRCGCEHGLCGCEHGLMLCVCVCPPVQEQYRADGEPVSWCRASTSSEARASLPWPAPCWNRGWDTRTRTQYIREPLVTGISPGMSTSWVLTIKCSTGAVRVLPEQLDLCFVISSFWFLATQRAAYWLKLQLRRQCISIDHLTTAQEGTTLPSRTRTRYMSIYIH